MLTPCRRGAEARCGSTDPSPSSFVSHLPLETARSLGSELPLSLQAAGVGKALEYMLLLRSESHLLALKDPFHLPLGGGGGGVWKTFS